MIKKIALLLVSLFTLIYPVDIMADTPNKIPDFAFPETVIEQSETALNDALAANDYNTALRAAMNMCIAKNMKSQESAIESIAMLDSIASRMPAEWSRLTLLIEATLYNSIYNLNLYKFDNRVLPLDEPWPDYILAWSREMYAKKVLDLVEAATKDITPDDSPFNTPLDVYANIVKIDKEQKKWIKYLTLADFLRFTGAQLLQTMAVAPSGNTIPFFKTPANSEQSPSEQCYELRCRLLDSVVEANLQRGNSVVEAMALLEQNPSEADIYTNLQRMRHSEGFAVLITRFSPGMASSEKKVELYKMCEEWIGEFPNSIFVNNAKLFLNQLSNQSVRVVDIPNVIVPNTATKAVAELENINKAFLLVYRVNNEALSTDLEFSANKFSPSKQVAAIPLETSMTVPFSANVDFELPPLSPGHYVCIISKQNKLAGNWKEEIKRYWSNIINVSAISIITIDDPVHSRLTAYVVDARTQQPVQGATVRVKSTRYKDNFSTTGVSAADGSYVVERDGSYSIKAVKDGSQVIINASTHTASETVATHAFHILPDLAVYRPGDNVKFAVIAWSKTQTNCQIAPGLELEAKLRDANYKTVSTLRLTTDASGRANGEFKLNTDALLGRYTIVVDEIRPGQQPQQPEESKIDEDEDFIVIEEDFGTTSGSCSFQVADYKLPRFYVTAEQSHADSDTLTFGGEVKTFTGMPLGGVVVNYRIAYKHWWRWTRTSDSPSYASSVETEADGSYRISLPLDNLKGTDYENGTFTIEVEATSTDGDTQEAPTIIFFIRDKYQIETRIPEIVEITSDTLSLNVPVKDMAGMPAIKEVGYTVLNDTATIASGTFTSPLLTLNAKDLTSGKYTFLFKLPGDSVDTEATAVLYRRSDARPPIEIPLWLPVKSFVGESADSTVNIPVGSGYSDSWIFYAINNGKEIIKSGWLKSDGENVSIDAPVPQGYDRLTVLFSGLHNFNKETETVTVVNRYAMRRLTADVASFRDRLSAGDREQWRFNFRVDALPAQQVFAMAVMTDKALNSIAPFQWQFTPSLWNHFNSTSIGHVRPYNLYLNSYYSKNCNLSALYLMLPDWQTYDYGFVNYHHGMILYSYKTSRALGNAVKLEAVEDMELDMAPPMYASMAVSDDAEVSLEVAEEVAETTGSTTDAGEGGTTDTVNIELRPVEMPVAFFMPTLTTSDNGELTVEFDVPNFNTTWQFQLLGYTPDMLTSTAKLDVVAAKPVMAQANMPMYLRTGDKTSLKALLFNNSDSILGIGGRIEIINPLSSETVFSKAFAAQDVEPSGNREISLDFVAPTNLSQIEVRVYALTSGFSDGESMVIPIYPSSSPVIESAQFYLGSGARSVTVKVPSLKSDANVTLRYCADPVRECMLAMPALSEPDSKTAIVLSQALYANSVANSVATRFPHIKESLERLFSTEEYKELKSALETDSNLKVVGLNCTPWVNNARNERERMWQLGTLLDTDRANKAITSLCEQLAKLQNGDGGWSWCEGMKSSLFITREILLEFGEMNRAGCLPTEAGDMIAPAFIYCDKQIVADYNRYKVFSVNSMMEYLYTKSFFTDAPAESSEFKHLRTMTIKQILEEWRKFSTRDKAVAALLLHRTGGHSDAVAQIMRSLSEFTFKDENKGWWFGNLNSGYQGWERLLSTSMALNAYAEIEPESEAVDGLRQWLLLQKETEDWGSRNLTVQVIQSIMASGTEWGTNIELPVITINNKPLDLGNVSTDGMFTLSIDPKIVSGKEVKVSKTGDTPAWGGIISQYVAPMKEVKKADCENLKITKQVLTIHNDGGTATARQNKVNIGDKVRVTLTIECDKDMDYVAVVDERGACLQPDEWLSGYAPCGDFRAYRETRDNRTSFFIEFLPKGTHVITYDCHADRQGEYATGIATVQSQYAPQNVAHSAGQITTVNR